MISRHPPLVGPRNGILHHGWYYRIEAGDVLEEAVDLAIEAEEILGRGLVGRKAIGFQKGKDVRGGNGGVNGSEEGGEGGCMRGLSDRDETGRSGEGFVVNVEAHSALVLGVKVERVKRSGVIVRGFERRRSQDEAGLARELSRFEQSLLGGDGEGAAEDRISEEGARRRIVSVSRAERGKVDSTYEGWVAQTKVACILGSCLFGATSNLQGALDRQMKPSWSERVEAHPCVHW